MTQEETYYAAQKTADFVNMVRSGLRNLTDPSAMAPYYENAPRVPVDEVGPRYEESADFRTENDLVQVGETAFSSQIAYGASQENFSQFVQEMGLEKEYQEDITVEATTSLPALTALDPVIDALVAKGFTPDIDGLIAKYPSIEVVEENILHIEETDPSTWAEEDSAIAENVGRARTFVSLYVEGGSA